MVYGIIRVEKIKSSDAGDFFGRVKHNLREAREPLNIDQKKTKDNIYEGAQTAIEVYQAVKARWATIEGKIRSDAVGCLEIMVSISKNNDITELDYLHEAKKFIQNLYGAENIVLLSILLDTEVPHMHAFVVPLEKKPYNGQEKMRLNAGKIFKNRASLRQLQNNFYEQVSSKFGLCRGQFSEETRAKNSRPTLAKRAKELDQREDDLNQREKQIREQEKKQE